MSNNSNMELYKELTKSLPDEALGTFSRGGKKLTFAAYGNVVDRLNAKMGVDKWSFQILKTWEERNHILAHTRVTYHKEDGRDSFREAIKGKQIDDRIAIENTYASAVSNSLKKAAQKFGVGLYLSMNFEEDWDEEEVTSAPKQSTQTVSSGTENFDYLTQSDLNNSNHDDSDTEIDAILRQKWYKEFVAKAKLLQEDDRIALKEYWYDLASPDPIGEESLTYEMIDQLAEYMVELAFNHEEV